MSAGWLDVTGQEAASPDGQKLDFDRFDELACYLSYRLENTAGDVVSSGSSLFCAPKHFRFVDPCLQVRSEAGHVVVQAAAYARSVELVSEDPDCLFEDNFFDMDGGERKIAILRGTPGKVTARSVRDIGLGL